MPSRIYNSTIHVCVSVCMGGALVRSEFTVLMAYGNKLHFSLSALAA